MLARQVFGTREYTSIWSLISTAGSAGTFVTNPVWESIYDMTGSYPLGLIADSILLLAAIAAMLMALNEEKAKMSEILFHNNVLDVKG